MSGGTEGGSAPVLRTPPEYFEQKEAGRTGGSHSGLLTLARWLSPAFPLGSFAYSHGLEAAVAEGAVRDAAGLEAWLAGVLRHGAGLCDAVLLCRALAGDDPAALDAEAAARAVCAARREEGLAQGRAFARTLAALGEDAPDMTLPVAIGVAARRLDLPPALVTAQYLQAFAGALVMGATRLMPLGQAAAQGVLARLAPVAEEVAARAVTLPLEAVGGAVFAADLAAMGQETLEVRLFRS